MGAWANVVVGILALGVWAIFAAQLKSGSALKLGRGMGPKTSFSRDSEPGAYWLNQVALLIGGGALLFVALTQELR